MDGLKRRPTGKCSRPLGMVFGKFCRLGSARQTLMWLRDEGIDAAARRGGGSAGQEVIWRAARFEPGASSVAQSVLRGSLCVWVGRPRG